MPRFFFDFFDGRTWSADDFGLELATVEEAYLQAFAGARGMWPELVGARQDPLACAFEVRGEDGEALFRLGFAELLDSCRDGARSQPCALTARTLEDTHRRASSARDELRASLADVQCSLAESRTLIARLGAYERRRAG